MHTHPIPPPVGTRADSCPSSTPALPSWLPELLEGLRATERPWSPADVLTLAATAKRLRIGKDRCRDLCERHGLLRTYEGAARVVWGDVLELGRCESAQPVRTPSDALRRVKLTGGAA